MKQKPVYMKVAWDVFWQQAQWTIVFLSIVFLVHLVKRGVYFIYNDVADDFFSTAYISSNVYMFVIGIISGAVLLPYFVKNGVTRKDYYKGAVLGTLGLSLAMVIVIGMIVGLEYLFIKTGYLSHEIRGGTDKNIIAQIITGMLIAPVVDLEKGWILTYLVFCINLFTYYVSGWMIGAAFYNFALFGFIAIALHIFFLWLRDTLWESEFPLYVPLAGMVLIISIILLIIRFLTRKVIIKL